MKRKALLFDTSLFINFIYYVEGFNEIDRSQIQ